MKEPVLEPEKVLDHDDLLLHKILTLNEVAAAEVHHQHAVEHEEVPVEDVEGSHGLIPSHECRAQIVMGQS